MANPSPNRKSGGAARRKRQQEASFQDAAHTPVTFTAGGQNRCAWCGKLLPSLPFQFEGLVLCADCYGPQHYRQRPQAPEIHDSSEDDFQSPGSKLADGGEALP